MSATPLHPWRQSSRFHVLGASETRNQTRTRPPPDRPPSPRDPCPPWTPCPYWLTRQRPGGRANPEGCSDKARLSWDLVMPRLPAPHLSPRARPPPATTAGVCSAVSLGSHAHCAARAALCSGVSDNAARCNGCGVCCGAVPDCTVVLGCDAKERHCNRERERERERETEREGEGQKRWYTTTTSRSLPLNLGIGPHRPLNASMLW